MTLNARCTKCGEPESPRNRLDRSARVIAGLVLEPRPACADEAACLARQLTPSREYSAAHAAVLANRRARLS